MLPMCGIDACSVLPVVLRPPTDYLWQRDPFQVSGGSSESIEMRVSTISFPTGWGRYYGVIAPDPVPPVAQ